MRSSRVLRILALLFVMAQAGYFILAWLVPGPIHFGPISMSFTANGISPGGAYTLSPGARVFGAALSLPSLLLLCYALWRMDRMLRAFEQGRMFDLVSIAHLKAFAAAMLGSLALAIVETPLRALAYRHLLDDAKAKVTMIVSSEQLAVILVCALFYVIAAMMHEGRRLAQENEGFV